MTTPHDAVQIGCGNRGQTRARALADSDRFEFVAACDVDESAARETAAEFDVPAVYTDLDEALTAEDPTHVSLVTPATVRRDVVAVLGDHAVARYGEDGTDRSADEGGAVDLAEVE